MPFTLLLRLAFRLCSLLLQPLSHLSLYLTHVTEEHCPVRLVPRYSQILLHGLFRPCTPFHMVIVPLVVHHQQRVVLKHLYFPIYSALVAIQQANHIPGEVIYHPLLDFFLWLPVIGQSQIQPILPMPSLGGNSPHLIQFPGSCTQVTADDRNLKVPEVYELRHLGIKLSILHVDEELPLVGFAFLILDSVIYP